MQKKRINIVLILIVLGLWGTVGYKYVNRFFSSNETTKKEYKNNNFSLNIITKDTFELQNINRDPFLNKSSIVKQVVIPQTPRPIKIPEVKMPIIINWPQISYYGYVKSKSKDNELILIKIEERLFKTRLNNTHLDVLIKKIYKDSIEVFFNKTSKIIRKN